MKKHGLIMFAGVMLFLFLSTPIMAQSGKIYFVDSYRIRVEYKEFTDAQAQFDKELDEWQNEALTMEQEVDSLKRDLNEKALLLSEEARTKKEELIATKEAALQKYMIKIFGQGGDAEKRNRELTAPLLDKITAILEKIALDNNYDYVFDAVNGNIAYAKKSLDITDKVLDELSKSQ